MLDFEPIELRHRERALPYLCSDHMVPTEGSFAALYMWGKVFDTQVCFKDDFLFIRSGKNGEYFYQFPWGNGELSHALELIKNDALERGVKPKLISVTDAMRDALEAAMPGKLEYTPARDSFDYIYNAEDLRTLAGRSFHQKRNNVNKFKKLLDGRYVYERFTSADLEEVYECQKKWLENNINDEKRESLMGEMGVIERAFAHFDELGLIGGLIRVDGEIAAYTIGSKLCCCSFLVSIEKADIQYPGIYQAINQFFAADAAAQARYINREDDAGVEGLRRAKMSYNPEILLTKYCVTWK